MITNRLRIMAVVLTCFLAACTKDGSTIFLPDPAEELASIQPLVTVIYDANAVGDCSYNDLIYRGVEQVAQQLGLRTLQLSPQSQAEGLQYLEQMFRQMESATDSVRRLFIVANPGYDTYLRQNNHRLEGNAYADLLYLETPVPLEGKGSTIYMPYYGAMFEAGAFAPHISPGTMMIAANRQTQSVVDAVDGFTDGYDSGLTTLALHSKKQLGLYYIDTEGEGGFSIPDTTALRLMRQWGDEDYTDLLPVCGGAFHTFWRMNNIIFQGFYMIGVDTEYTSGHSHMSVVKHVDRAVGDAIRQWYVDGSMPKHQILGLASGYTELINHFDSLIELNGEDEELSAEKREEIHQIAIKKEGEMENRIIAALLVLFSLSFISCHEDDKIVFEKQREWVGKTVAVVAPLSADANTRARFERTAAWFLDNLHQAQLHNTRCIDLKIEWHDELTENLESLGEQLASRDDVTAVIGPFGNEAVTLLAPACQKTHKPVIAPTATSEDVIRRFAVGTAGVENKAPFLWSLTETDITFSEVLMNIYASFVKNYGEDINSKIAMFSPNDTYGKTFFDWGPYQAEEMGIPFAHNLQYDSDAQLRQQMKDYLDELNTIGTFDSFLASSFCITESLQQIYDIARIRIEWWGNDPDDLDLETLQSFGEMFEGWGRTYFANCNLTDEGIQALGDRAAYILNGYQGFSPYADPSTGFELSYEVKFGTKPTFSECKFYDALMLAAFAASYVEHQDSEAPEAHQAFNDAIIAITTPTSQQLSAPAWSQTAMDLYLTAMEQGHLYSFIGASGTIRFDSETYTSALHSTYVHWQIRNGRVDHVNYLSSDGSRRTSSTMSAWNWLVQNAEDAFANEAENKETGITYPPLTDQYAVLVQGSNGWNNYRHQADVLSIYQMLRKNGFDDDHIILILDKSLAADTKNPEPGIIRAEDGGPNLLAGAVIDYDNAALTPVDISNMLQGMAPGATNILLYWSGHGRNKTGDGIDELAWRDEPPGQGMTATLLRSTVTTMQSEGCFRKMLVVTEPCYSESVITSLVGIPGVLAMSSAGTYEQSFADNWSTALGVWRCDRFSRNLVTHLSHSPASTYRDLYLYCARHTLGSHVHIVNSAHFGNLYTTGPQEFFDKVKP